jgi:sugar/nucleoside kinase (ribokinase family)
MITVAGTLVADLMVRPVRSWPAKGGVAFVDTIEVKQGGAVANTGLALERLGVPVSACAAVGADDLGLIIKGKVGKWASHDEVRVLPTIPTTTTIVVVAEDGDRSFINAPGACEKFFLTEHQIETQIARGSRAIHVGYAMILPAFDGKPLLRAMRRARELGSLTSLDVTYFESPRWPSLLELMPEIDVFCPSLPEASMITGEPTAERAAAALVKAGVRKFAAVTDGPRGALVHLPGEKPEWIPPLPVKAVDTTGAGDAFVAGVLAAWYRNLPWQEAGRIGIYASSLAVTSHERYGNLRSWAQVLEAGGERMGE